MATVDTTYGTYLSNLFNPQVIADLIDEKLIDNIVFAPLARIDTTLVGRAGNTVTLPFYNYIGKATVVAEGTDIPIAKLTQSTKQVTIVKYGQGIQMTDEAVLSGYGDPIGEGVGQIRQSIADAVDDALITALDGNTSRVFTVDERAVDDIPQALALFGEDSEGVKVLICDPNFYVKLLRTDWVPASEIAADIRVRGAVGMAYGCQVIVSNRVKDGNFYIVKPGALAIFMKRDTLVETDRDIVNQSTVMTGSKLFAPYLLDESKTIKLVAGIDSGLPKITLASAQGTNSGTTAITVSGYTPGAGESYVYSVGNTVKGVSAGEDLSGWTAWDGSADITAATGKIITIASVKSSKAVAAGSTTVTAKP